MAGAVKAFHLTPRQALYDISYANIVLLGATLPTYTPKSKHKEKEIRADDPRNRDRVRQFLQSIE